MQPTVDQAIHRKAPFPFFAIQRLRLTLPSLRSVNNKNEPSDARRSTYVILMFALSSLIRSRDLFVPVTAPTDSPSYHQRHPNPPTCNSSCPPNGHVGKSTKGEFRQRPHSMCSGPTCLRGSLPSSPTSNVFSQEMWVILARDVSICCFLQAARWARGSQVSTFLRISNSLN